MTWPWVRCTWDRRIGSQASNAPSSSRIESKLRPAMHMVPDDVDLPFDPTFPGRPVGGEDVDGEAVMVGERGRFRMQRHRQPGGDVAPDDGLGAVIDERARDATEVRERSPVTIPERRQIHAGGETAERVAGMRQHHVERIHLGDADMGQQVALVAPVNLRLRTRDDLEAAVQTRSAGCRRTPPARRRSAAGPRPGTS